MIDPGSLRIAAAICSVIGSGLLAWRVKRILDALSLVAKAHELNIQQLMQNPDGDRFYFGNSTKHIEKTKGTWLLVVGFVLLALTGGLNLWASIL